LGFGSPRYPPPKPPVWGSNRNGPLTVKPVRGKFPGDPGGKVRGPDRNGGPGPPYP